MNSEIILCKDIKLDKNYNNVLDYTEEQMVALCRQNQIASSNKYSFIRPTNNIYSGFTYSQCLQANYIAFRNPDYSNKWFFAFIDEVIYKSDKNTEIRYTVDSWSTWFSYWTKKNCYIVRQHVNDDTVGSNTQPETVDLGKAMVVENEIIKDYSSMNIAMFRTGSATAQYGSSEGKIINGVYTAIGYSVLGAANQTTADSTNQVLNAYFTEGTEDRILRIFQYPSAFGGFGQLINMYTEEVTFTPLPTIDSYTPVNNKLLTYPYKQLKIVSSNGQDVTLQYELFSDNKLQIDGTVLPTVTAKIYPKNYRGLSKDFTKSLILDMDVECTWVSDEFKSWFANNKISIALSEVGALIGGIANPLSLVSNGGNLINEFYQARKSSGQAHGKSSSGLDISENNLGFRILQESIKAEYAREIDSYFTRYGYAINNIESPNITGRQNWNYIEIGQNESIGYGSVPSGFMEIINNTCRRGVTIWHNHTNLGDFSLSNSIVQ